MIISNFRQAAVLCAIALVSLVPARAQKAGPSPSPSPAFTILESPNQSNQNYLKGVAPISSNDVWAVGYYFQDGLFLNLAMHWNGSNWTFFPTPNPGQPTYNSNQIKKVVAISTNDVWAVGGHQLSYILHWNGSAWSEIPRPPLAFNYLEDIAAVASNDIWIVGAIDSFNGGTLTLTLHWNGSEWTRIPSPNVPTPGGNFYSAGLDSVVAVAANDVWAVGYYRVGNRQHTLVLHWNGTQWSIVPSPDGPTGDGWLHGIAAAGANDIWAVGEYDKPEWTVPGKALAMHWNGVSWTTFVPPAPSPFRSSPLHSVVARGPNDFYAVGESQNSSQGLNTFAVRWDGTAWTQIPSENPPGSGTGWNELRDVARDSGGNLWAVGNKQASFGSPNYTLVQRANLAAAPVAISGVYSRKEHGEAGTFDVQLPASGSTGIECRTGGVNGDHTIVFTFMNSLASVGGASVVSGTGNITSSGMGADAREYVVNLTGVANAQQITVALTNVTDSAGNNSASVPISMGVLFGDTNGDGFVNAGDALQTRNRSGQASSATNFRSDVNVDGFVNSGDALAVRARAGTGLNAAAQTEKY